MINILSGMKRKVAYAIKGKISTPIWIYAILFFGSLLMIRCGTDSICEIAKNVGYSVFASVIAALLIDVGNSQVERKKLEKELRLINSEFRNAFIDLHDSVVTAYEIRYGDDGKKRKFQQWVELALRERRDDEGLSDDEMFDVTWEVQWCLCKISKTSEVLIDRLMDHISLSLANDVYRSQVKHIRAVSYILQKDLDKECYSQVINSINRQLVPSFLKIHPEYTQMFETEYSNIEGDDD